MHYPRNNLGGQHGSNMSGKELMSWESHKTHQCMAPLQLRNEGMWRILCVVCAIREKLIWHFDKKCAGKTVGYSC
jgi:hypothetical protein